MGDRIVYQCVSKEDVGPAVYAHNGGSDARRVVKELRQRMKDRPDDLAYVSARLVEIAIGNSAGSSIGFGMWNAPERLTAEESHGDAGVVLISLPSFAVECFGGYLRVAEDGSIFDKYEDDNEVTQ